jgi:hypothetical protein
MMHKSCALTYESFVHSDTVEIAVDIGIFSVHLSSCSVKNYFFIFSDMYLSVMLFVFCSLEAFFACFNSQFPSCQSVAFHSFLKRSLFFIFLASLETKKDSWEPNQPVDH